MSTTQGHTGGFPFPNYIRPTFDGSVVWAEHVGYNETSTVKQILDALGAGFTIEVTTAMPTSPQANVMYLVPVPGKTYYNKYIYPDGSTPQLIGTTETELQGLLLQTMVGGTSDLKLEGGKLMLVESQKGSDGKNANVLLKRKYTKGTDVKEYKGEYNAAVEDALVAAGYTIDCRLSTWVGDTGEPSDAYKSPNLMADVNRVMNTIEGILDGTIQVNTTTTA